MKTVLFLSRADWAGTGYFTASAINSIGRINCRQLTFFPHPYGYPQDLMIPICFVPAPYSLNAQDLIEEKKVIEEADLIHIWNDEIFSFDGVCNFPIEKVKSYTFSGSYYRLYHPNINKRMKKMNSRIVVQNPTYCFPDEIKAEFIPHAIDLSRFKVTEEKQEGAIGCYNPMHGATTARADIALLENILKMNFKDWHLVLGERSTWQKRMQGLSKCALYFEYMDRNMGYIGQSALEACAFGIPVMSYISEKAILFGGERLVDPGIFTVTEKNLKERLDILINQPDVRRSASLKAREWVEKYFSYEAVGELYTKFFEEML